jgi:hypothetical protein
MSGYSENMIDFDDREDKNVHFLQKPVLPSNILRKIRDLPDHENTGV